MKKYLKTFLGAFIATFVITIGLFQSIAVNADVTTNFWLKGSDGQLYTNSGNGRGNAVINVAGCNGCGGTSGSNATWGGITGVLSNQTDLNNALTARELIANKSSLTTLGTSNTLYPTQNAVKTYVDGLLVGVFNYRGAYDASGNTFPATGGSGAGGAIQKGDLWIISVAGTLGGDPVEVGDSIIAAVNTPGQTAGNWNILEGNISYVPEDVANKVDNFLSPNNTTYPTTSATFDLFQSTFEGTATQIPYYNTSGVRTSDGLFTRDSNTLFTNISTPINGGDDTISFLSGEIEPFPGSPLPGIGLQYSAPGDDRITIFGIIDGTVFGAGKGVFAASAQNTANGDIANIVTSPEFIQISTETGTRTQFGLNISQSATSLAYIDDIDSPTNSFGLSISEFGISVDDYVEETNWYIGLTPGTETGQVFSWDNSINTGVWANAAITYDSITGNLFSADTINGPARNFAITLGNLSGQGATNASEMIALGVNAGVDATAASNSIFIGSGTGVGGTQLYNTIAIGSNAGNSSPLASNSIFIGRNAGFNDTVDNFNTTAYSILIGDSTSTGGNSNSVAIGSGATNTAPNEFLVQSPIYPFLYGNFDFNETVRIGDLSGAYTSALLEMNLNPGSIIGYTRAMFNFDRVTFNSRVAEQIQTIALDNGDTAIIDNAAYASNYIIRPDGGSIASGTIELPAVPQQGDMINLLIEGTITALTIDPGTNAVAGTLPTTVTTYDSVQLIYSSDTSTWYVKN